MNNGQLSFKYCKSSDDFKQIQKLHKEIWGLKDVDVTPGHIYSAIINNGGLVIIAYLKNMPAGYIFGFPGHRGGEKYFYIHNIGVHYACRNQGIGLKLKLQMASEILNRGFTIIKWTYDPLDTKNANLYIRKLNGVPKEYIPNYYGEMLDEINKGVASNRLIISWDLSKVDISELEHRNVQKEPSIDTYISLLSTARNQNGDLKVIGISQPENIHSLYKIPVPVNMEAIKLHDKQLAQKWSVHISTILDLCYKNHIRITNIFYNKKEFYYLLERQK
uniref:GNAT family N-acetyltransferase n=1 Tax=uncultured Draconibacterium sp. TaxID=1573823 RepID=UPI0032180705